MKHRLFGLWTVFFLVSAGCSDSQIGPEMEPLSRDLFELASLLSKKQDCVQKGEQLVAWMEKNAQNVAEHKKSFDEACQRNNPSDFTCMSFQILSSAGVEVELRDCAEEPEITSNLVRLNQIAGTAILKK